MASVNNTALIVRPVITQETVLWSIKEQNNELLVLGSLERTNEIRHSQLALHVKGTSKSVLFRFKYLIYRPAYNSIDF